MKHCFIIETFKFQVELTDAVVQRETLEGVFDEKRVKILKFFVNNTDDKFYLREVSRAAGVAPATTYRIINSLVENKMLKLTQIKKTKLYELSDDPKAQLVRNILEEKKSAIQEFTEFCSKIEGVERIILHGEETKDKTNILIIGNADPSTIKQKVGEIKDDYKISIIELTLSPEQFRQMSVMGLFPGKKKQLWPKSD